MGLGARICGCFQYLRKFDPPPSPGNYSAGRLHADGTTLIGMTSAPWWATILSTALGAVIAGGAAWLNASRQSSRERRKDNLSTRRQAYADFLQRTRVLWNLIELITAEVLAAAFTKPKPEKGPLFSNSPELKTKLHTAFDESERAWHMLELCAPTPIIEEARRLRKKWRMPLEPLLNSSTCVGKTKI